MPKRTSVVDPSSAQSGAAPSIAVVVVTMDRHSDRAFEAAAEKLALELPGLTLRVHAASDFASDPRRLEACLTDLRHAHIILAAMLFMEDHFHPVVEAIQARRQDCDAVVGIISAGEVVRLTRMGSLSMDGKEKGPIALLKRLRGAKKPGGASSGAGQMAMLRRLPKLLRFIPGPAQDLRAYFLCMQYWLSGSEANLTNLVRFLVHRYASGERRALRARVRPEAPLEYPETGLYHPALERRIATKLSELPTRSGSTGGRVGVLLMRSYVLSGDTRHYDAVIEGLEARGLDVVPAFASGLDARPAALAYFTKNGKATVDAVVSLTGFSLVGGPAFSDARAAEELLTQLDVPYISAQAIEFQSIEEWQASGRGLLPVESTIMVAIPELDGATGPIVYAGRSEKDLGGDRQLVPIPSRVDMLAARVAQLVKLRRTPKHERRLAVVLFDFPPNSGAAGTAAYLSVFESLYNVMKALAADGYELELPASVEALREAVLGGNALVYGTDGNVAAKIPVDDHVRREPHLADIEAQWGPAPGRALSNGSSIFVLGARFGNLFVGLQPPFGYEGDPMRLLFEAGFAPTHAFSAFYRYLREDLGAHALLHFGTHGALEFMPGKQTGLSSECWPDRLIQDIPNFYVYAANNPSEGTIAKRRSAATLISHLTPPVSEAGLYRELLELKDSLERWRSLGPDEHEEQARMLPLIQAQAARLDLDSAEPVWGAVDSDRALTLLERVRTYESTLIPCGLHVIGAPSAEAARVEYVARLAEASGRFETSAATRLAQALVEGHSPERALERAGHERGRERIEEVAGLARVERALREDHETPAILRALDGRFIAPAPGGDLLRNPEVLPTGRNIHGFDPFRLPSAFAVADGARQAQRLLERHLADGHDFPESIALVLWGTDNLKSEGGPIGQVLSLLGAEPRFDGYGRLAGARLLPLERLGRPRIDVIVTLSGIFRDLLPLQTRLLAEAAYLAASADEPLESNFVRRHTLEHQSKIGCDLETAALRIFSNADGAYGSNVNMLVDSGAWTDEDQLAEAFTQRKCFAYGRSGQPARQDAVLTSALAGVQLAYQNLESVELGVTTVDHYFDTLGGIGRAVRRARGATVPVYIGDQTRGEGAVRTLSEQVSLESRTRMLNPKWYEGLLEHGPEGVRHIEASVTNTLGWSATTGQVAPWVYKQLSETYVLDPALRTRMAELNPRASARLANRLLEAHERNYWSPDPDMLEALRAAGDELEDRLEGMGDTVAA